MPLIGLKILRYSYICSNCVYLYVTSEDGEGFQSESCVTCVYV